VNRRQRAFTLIEVVVAVAIAAIALVALAASTGQSIKNSAYLRDKLFAQWVASNAMNQMWLTTSFPARGKQEGEETLGGRDWRWEREVTETQNPLVRRVDISVYFAEDDEDEGAMARLSAFTSEAIQIRQRGGEEGEGAGAPAAEPRGRRRGGLFR
jgi:general secretion pathway protein I